MEPLNLLAGLLLGITLIYSAIQLLKRYLSYRPKYIRDFEELEKEWELIFAKIKIINETRSELILIINSLKDDVELKDILLGHLEHMDMFIVLLTNILPTLNEDKKEI